MPLVSVVLPNYNYARYLKERVRTILGQRNADLELIYIDDGSSDESNRVVESFGSDSRLRMVLHAQNSGRVYQRWNEGAALAKGEWLWFAGADDVADPDFLEQLLSLASRYPRAAILYARQDRMDGAGRLLSAPRIWPAPVTPQSSVSGPEIIVSLLRNNFLESASSMLLRRDVFEALGGFDARLWLAADWHLYLSMLEKHDIAFCYEPLIAYRQHTGTVTKSTRAAVTLIENAFCVARAAAWVQRDPRCSKRLREATLRMARLRVFDLFADPKLVIPDGLQFALEAIDEVVPDARLRAAGGLQADHRRTGSAWKRF